jgi:hypothetical protein
VRVTERLYRRWCKHASSGKAFDLQADLMRFTVDAVAGLAFGMDFNTIESEQETIQTHLNYDLPDAQSASRRAGQVLALVQTSLRSQHSIVIWSRCIGRSPN